MNKGAFSKLSSTPSERRRWLAHVGLAGWRVWIHNIVIPCISHLCFESSLFYTERWLLWSSTRVSLLDKLGTHLVCRKLVKCKCKVKLGIIDPDRPLNTVVISSNRAFQWCSRAYLTQWFKNFTNFTYQIIGSITLKCIVAQTEMVITWSIFRFRKVMAWRLLVRCSK